MRDALRSPSMTRTGEAGPQCGGMGWLAEAYISIRRRSTPRQARGSFRARARGGCTRTERDALRYTHWGGWDEVAG